MRRRFMARSLRPAAPGGADRVAPLATHGRPSGVAPLATRGSASRVAPLDGGVAVSVHG